MDYCYTEIEHVTHAHQTAIKKRPTPSVIGSESATGSTRTGSDSEEVAETELTLQEDRCLWIREKLASCHDWTGEGCADQQFQLIQNPKRLSLQIF